MKHSLMISWQRKEKFSLLGGMVLWEKCKHNYILFQQISSSLVCALRLLPSRLLPRSEALSESPCCAWMFWQAWELPGGIRQDPPGSWGCTLLALTAERRCCLCPCQAEHIQGPLVHTSTSPTPQYPRYTETERVLRSLSFIDFASGERWGADSIQQIMCFCVHRRC